MTLSSHPGVTANREFYAFRHYLRFWPLQTQIFLKYALYLWLSACFRCPISLLVRRMGRLLSSTNFRLRSVASCVTSCAFVKQKFTQISAQSYFLRVSAENLLPQTNTELYNRYFGGSVGQEPPVSRVCFRNSNGHEVLSVKLRRLPSRSALTTSTRLLSRQWIATKSSTYSFHLERLLAVCPH